MEQIVNYFALHPAVLGVSVIVAAVVMFFFSQEIGGPAVACRGSGGALCRLAAFQWKRCIADLP